MRRMGQKKGRPTTHSASFPIFSRCRRCLYMYCYVAAGQMTGTMVEDDHCIFKATVGELKPGYATHFFVFVGGG